MNLKKILILISVCYLSGSVYAGTTSNSTSGLAFLRIPVGPRAVALGGAYAGLSDDGLAVNYNPSGLIQMKNKEVNFTYNKYFQETAYQYLGYVQPIWRLDRVYYIGVSVNNLSNSDIQGRDGFGTPTRKLTFGDQMLSFTYAQSLFSQVNAGINLKYITETIADEKAVGYAADLGFMYTPEHMQNLNVGLCAQNLGGDITFVKEADKMPLNIKAGLGLKLLDGDIVTVLDYNMPNDNAGSISAGFEYWIIQQLALRIGYKSGEELNSGLRFGIGINADRIGFDYAFVPYNILGDTHQIGLKVKFGGVLSEGKSLKKRIKEHLEKGVRYYWQDDLVSAHKEFRNILDLDPTNEGAKDYIGKIKQRIKEVDISDKIKRHLELGRNYYYKKDIVNAKEEFENIRLLDPENEESRRYLDKIDNRLEESKKLQIEMIMLDGKKLLESKQYEKAAKECEKILALDSGNGDAKQYYSICNLEIQKKKENETQKEKERLFAAATNKNTRGQLREAKKDLENALRIDPMFEKAQELLTEVNRKIEAMGLNKKDESKRLYNQGLEEYNKGNTRKAIQIWEEAVSLNPDNLNAVRALERAKKQ
ncbi:MAG: hypothetical protein A3J83_05960 [Elusimicrobia bacterium RIFOXYA2_FULL_40_6]|nr:MAG: hypothetical protein A3J83_05960 [Elusimicrobia bacterium RIFOXYA2_FULL_40_6]